MYNRTRSYPQQAMPTIYRAYRLVLDNGSLGAKYNAPAEEGVAFREIAEVTGRGLKVPVDSLSSEELAVISNGSRCLAVST